MRWGSGLAGLALAVAVAGCAGTRASGPPSGQAVFAQACSGCHSLSGANSPRRQGGDLLHLHLSRAVMEQFVREMPVTHPLTPTGVQAVVDYVVMVEQRGS